MKLFMLYAYIAICTIMCGVSDVSAMEGQNTVSQELVHSYMEIIKAVTRRSPSNSSALFLDKLIDVGMQEYYDRCKNKKILNNKLSPFEADAVVENAKKRIREELSRQKDIVECNDASDSQKKQKHVNATVGSNE